MALQSRPCFLPKRMTLESHPPMLHHSAHLSVGKGDDSRQFCTFELAAR